MNWVIVTLLLSAVIPLSIADPQTCERARCVHCENDFIRRSCPQACGACALPVENKPRPAQPPVLYQPTKPAPRQAEVQTQTHRQPAQAFAAPNQVYPQVSTLAPLIEQPHADHLNPQLANRPADLAQSYPEYQRFSQAYNGQQQFNYNQGQSQNFQQPANYGQAQRAAYPSQQQSPAQPAQGQYQQGFGYNQQQQSQFYNPFQSFFGNGFNAQNPLDPFGLFSQNNFAQAAPVAQVAAPRYAQPSSQPAASSFNGNYNPQANAQQTFAQPQAQMPQLQLPQMVQMPSLFQSAQLPPSPPAPLGVTQPLLPSQPAQPQPSQQYKTSQTVPQPQQPLPQSQQPSYQPQPQPQQTLPQTSNSIDAAANIYNKYVDGKGPAPAPPPAQCPRQPGWAPCISKEVANERFRNCCARLGEGCAALCNYDQTLATMQLAVLTGRCPLNKVSEMMVCASGYEDATPCCEAYNVFEPGYEQCRPYCNPAAGLPQGGPLSDKYKCLVKLGAIQQCFYVSQKP